MNDTKLTLRQTKILDITTNKILNLHSILIKDLEVSSGIRKNIKLMWKVFLFLGGKSSIVNYDNNNVSSTS